MINDVILTALTPGKARTIARALREGQCPESLISPDFDRLTPYERATAAVTNNIRVAGDSLLGPVPCDAGLRRAVAIPPADIVAEVTASGLRGCGGAGFGTGAKWAMAAAAEGPRRFVICNADEGEPGTFKDRVLLTERPHLLIEGMTIAARAVDAREGIIYLRGEYAYLQPHLQSVIDERRARGLLGQNILGQPGFDFDIRIQMGAGAYICGEEGALISSCEGLPGEPKTRPPYPVTRGYLNCPTVVNNVETFSHVARIMDRGAAWFHALGTDKSHGTKLFSVSGDCRAPGIYELPYGVTVQDILTMAGADDAAAVQVGGPSGTMIGRDSFHRRLAFEDLATGGAVIIFSGARNILEIVEYYLSFFVHESCGYCTPCRVGNVFLQKAIAKLRKGHADAGDIANLRALSATIIETSRCGLGQTSPNPCSRHSTTSAGVCCGDARLGRRAQGQFRHPIRHRTGARHRETAVGDLRQGLQPMTDDSFAFTIDGVTVNATAGQTIMEAADAAGVYIPRLCDHEGLRHQGGCRVCTVKAAGAASPPAHSPPRRA